MGMDQYVLICAYILAGVLGLCVGSFLNVVIYRVPNGMSIVKPDSHCTTCDYYLKWYDNIPVLSYIMLGGKCRSCGERISPRYMIVEIVNALLWVLSVFMFWEQSIVYAVVSAIVSSILVCIFFIDLEHLLIFNRFVIMLAVAGVVALFFDGYTEWYDHVVGCVAGGGVFLLIYFLALGVLKREGLGFGDVKLAFAAGLFLGWQRLVVAMLIATVSASIILLVIKRVRGDEDGHEYPFGPFIAAGILISMYIGAPVMQWYLSLF